MQIAFLLYEQFTALDIVGPYELLRQLPGAESIFVAKQTGPVKNDGGHLHLVAEATLAEVPSPDVLVVGGGMQGTLATANDPQVLDWIRSVHAQSRFTTSVCTGSLILAAAGLLAGKPAACHWAAKDMLEKMGTHYSGERYVREGKIVTAAGVSAGMDMALYLIGELAGRKAAEMIQLSAEYDPDPPFDSGSIKKAAPATVEAVLARLGREIAEG